MSPPFCSYNFYFRDKLPKVSKLRRDASPLMPRPSITTVRIKVLVSVSFFLIHIILFKSSYNTVHRGYKENFSIIREFKDGSLYPPK